MQTQELGLGVVECAAVVEADEVFTALISAHGDAFLREASILLNVPDLEDPVGVECVDAATSLIATKVNDIVVFQRRSRAQINVLKGLSRRDVILTKLVRTVEEQHLAERVDCLQ